MFDHRCFIFGDVARHDRIFQNSCPNNRSSVSHKDEGKANLLKIIIERSNEPTRTSHVRSYTKSADHKRGTFFSRFLSVASHNVSRLINKKGNNIPFPSVSRAFCSRVLLRNFETKHRLKISWFDRAIYRALFGSSSRLRVRLFQEVAISTTRIFIIIEQTKRFIYDAT